MVSDVLQPIGVDDVTWLETKEKIHLVKPTNYLAPQVLSVQEVLTHFI